jgi:hypothetical protein
MTSRKQNPISSIIVAVCVLFAGTAIAEETPSGTLEISSKTIAIGVGVSWGHGTLKFKGKEHKFKVNGLSVVDLGISSVSAAGEVYNLKSVSDFAGTYSGGGAAIAVAGGAGAAELTNQNGVKVKLKSKKQGVQLTLAPAGMKIELVE